MGKAGARAKLYWTAHWLHTGRAAPADCEPHEGDERLVVASLAIRCRLRGGRAPAIAPAGLDAVRVSRRDPKLIKALQRAHQIAVALGWRSRDGSSTLPN